MNTKLEKYIEYIVSDLVKKTEIDYDNERIIFPFSNIDYNLTLTLPTFPSTSYLTFPHHPFSNHIKGRYGVRDEEIGTIWDRYKEIIQSMVSNG